ncbi:MAG: QueT transporter family protein [Bacilli bacterium]|nr:QueT transporter family protein [Bacilli bacterium]
MTVSLTRKIASNAIVAAIYFLLTMVTSPFAFGQIQVRIAEIMILLCFFRRDFVIGVTLGCLMANFGSTLGMWDVLIGTAATLVSSLLVAYASPKLLIATIWPILINAFAVGFELNWLLELPFWESALFVGIGEAIAIFVGYALFMVTKKNKGFHDAFGANRHLDFRF